MNKFKIRLNKTNSVNSVNKDNMVDVEFQQTTNPYMFTTNIKDTIDQYEVFEAERANCTNYRLITTIKPFCSNVLFNPITEIVYKEGSDDCIVVDDDVSIKLQDKLSATAVAKIYGSIEPTRAQMIRDTEYSRKEINFEYHPGTDIFNNHILRNTSFKIVNPTTNKGGNDFNTISDFLRRYDTEPIKYNKRTKINDTNNFKNKRLYDADDILSMQNGDAINNNLMEENGWFGFVNKSSVLAKKKENNKWVDDGFNKVINNREGCEFIDMYPDRTLFSFNPKYNPYRHRAEYNWDLFLTFPYKNDYSHTLISGGLLIKSIELAFNSVGRRIVLFSTYTKHNLSIGTAFNLYIANKDENEGVQIIRVENILVNSLGNIKKEDEEHYFYTTQTDIIGKILNNNEEIDDDTDNDIINTNIKNCKATFRLKHVVNGYESEYYIRKFKKLPNLNKINDGTEETDKLTLDKSYCVNEFEKWIEGKSNDFNKEQYQLAFSSTIYNDNNTQVTWTDGINIDNLLDNRGRPLTEIYLTIMKRNKGYSEWYTDRDVADSNIEYSHCFGNVSWGFDLLAAKSEEEINLQESLQDVKLIHNVDIDIVNADEFNGDIVEYNVTTCNETILEDCYFRFNTYLRENPVDYYTYQYDEITSDDYDYNNFNVTPFSLDKEKIGYLLHPEGYYYKAHYHILLKEFGEIHQESHFDLNIKNVAIRRNEADDSTYVVVQTKLPHHLAANDKIMLCNDNTDEMVDIRVKSVINSNAFTFASISENLDARTICDILNGKYDENNNTYSLKRYNNNIPFYAEKIDNTNRYLWRNVNNVGNKDNTALPEYRFANGYFYIDQDINFFLKRQDPFNEFGLWYSGKEEDNILPNDIIGNILKESNYEYKEETEATC